MEGTCVAVDCVDCAFSTTYRKLSDARIALDEHESTTGHEVAWEIETLAAGVTQAGADAGVCGHPECTNEDTPLVRPRPAADE